MQSSARPTQPRLDRAALGAVVPSTLALAASHDADVLRAIYAVVLDANRGILIGTASGVAAPSASSSSARSSADLAQWGVLLLDRVALLRDVVRLRDAPAAPRRPILRDQVPAAGAVGAQHRPVAVLRPRPQRRAAAPLLEVTVRWWDKVASTTYMTHFVFSVIVMARAVGHQPSPVGALHEAVRHAPRRGCIMFIVLPTAPPWMADRSTTTPDHHLTRSAGRGFTTIGFVRSAAQLARSPSTGATLWQRCRRCTRRSR